MESNATFLGNEMAQGKRAIELWEQVLSSLNLNRIIELGTWTGNFSLYLCLFCLSKGINFHTFDNVNKWRDGGAPHVREKIEFEKYFQQLDIFKNVEMIKSLIQKPGKVLLICDNGNKIKEFEIFAPFLKAGDVIAVHDWGTEITESDIQHISKLQFLKPIFLRESKVEAWTRIFQKSLKK